MGNKIEQVANVATQSGAAVAAGTYATFSMGWWNDNSAGVLAMAGVFGAACSFVGLLISWHYARKRAMR